ncbi:hypothetical protein LVJ82_00825 [Vitreoscilla massiliensis]|uniref:Uncharacterized protein n=1 Tax=Vitreoscilla massiliensis TaxID=1689272 RepID=A0ABY4E2R1_9NEIS|nr:hypothetical protein [Vitreoscilla massiliensis]UOO89085.1 hypothetical protein LVJ82_16835 [Vitreoscilla massiliensis]UOO89559.1 hypothetical protein LVJ82_00825 [Vitreoscilla massiliensis]
MTFEELDKKALLWNEIANWHRDIKERIATQIMLCNEEMVNEFTLNYFSVSGTYYANGHKLTTDWEIKFLDDYADSRFVFIEYQELCKPLSFVVNLFRSIHEDALNSFDKAVLIEAYRRVIESNFSKFVELSEKHDLMWAQGEAHKMSTLLGSEQLITVELTQGYWVFRDQNGKIRKPSTFKPVDLSDLV